MATRDEVRSKVAQYLLTHSEVSYRTLATKLKCSYSTIALIAREYGVVRKEQRKGPAITEDSLKALVEQQDGN